jgi:hypothetical protein
MKDEFIRISDCLMLTSILDHKLKEERQSLASQMRLLLTGRVGVSSSPGQLALVGDQVFRPIGLTLEKRF